MHSWCHELLKNGNFLWLTRQHQFIGIWSMFWERQIFKPLYSIDFHNLLKTVQGQVRGWDNCYYSRDHSVVNGLWYYFQFFSLLICETPYFNLLTSAKCHHFLWRHFMLAWPRLPNVLILYHSHCKPPYRAFKHSNKIKDGDNISLTCEDSSANLWKLEASKLGKNSRLVFGSCWGCFLTIILSTPDLSFSISWIRLCSPLNLLVSLVHMKRLKRQHTSIQPGGIKFLWALPMLSLESTSNISFVLIHHPLKDKHCPRDLIAILQNSRNRTMPQ